jgi:zf-MYND-like zinc finger, mRNA-binding
MWVAFCSGLFFFCGKRPVPLGDTQHLSWVTKTLFPSFPSSSFSEEHRGEVATNPQQQPPTARPTMAAVGRTCESFDCSKPASSMRCPGMCLACTWLCLCGLAVWSVRVCRVCIMLRAQSVVHIASGVGVCLSCPAPALLLPYSASLFLSTSCCPCALFFFFCMLMLPSAIPPALVCMKLGREMYFCSQECFRSGYAAHKLLHVATPVADPDMQMPREFHGHRFTGDLRPARVCTPLPTPVNCWQLSIECASVCLVTSLADALHSFSLRCGDRVRIRFGFLGHTEETCTQEHRSSGLRRGWYSPFRGKLRGREIICT